MAKTGSEEAVLRQNVQIPRLPLWLALITGLPSFAAAVWAAYLGDLVAAVVALTVTVAIGCVWLWSGNS